MAIAGVAVAVGTVAAAGIGAAASMQGAKKQASAIKNASLTENQYRAEVINFAREQYEAGRPLREIQEQFAQFGVDILPLLKQEIENPTFSEGYKLAASEGLDQLQKGFATSGSPDSGPAQIAAGRFVAGLTAAERDRHVDNLFRAAGFGTNAGAGAASAAAAASGAYGIGANLTNNLAGLQVQQGAVQAGLYGNLGNAALSAGGQGLAAYLGSRGASAAPSYSPGAGLVAFDQANPTAPFPQRG